MNTTAICSHHFGTCNLCGSPLYESGYCTNRNCDNG